MRSCIDVMKVERSQRPSLSSLQFLIPVKGKTASLRTNRMCVALPDAGQDTTCPTNLLANGIIWLDTYDCNGTKHLRHTKGGSVLTWFFGMWSVGRGPLAASEVKLRAVRTRQLNEEYIRINGLLNGIETLKTYSAQRWSHV